MALLVTSSLANARGEFTFTRLANMQLSYYDSIDDLLGRRETRYFGNGYINTMRSISGFKCVETDTGLDFSCIAALELPSLWSAKGNSRQTPHLSSIDVIELATECTRRVFHEVSSGREFSLGSIQKLLVGAGKEPVEEALDAISITGVAKRLPDEAYHLRAHISSMSVDVTFSIREEGKPRMTGESRNPVSIENVMLNRDTLTASAIVLPFQGNQDDSWSLSDCFASVAQVGQALLYNLDGVTREASNTLWMRKIAMTLSSGTPECNMPQPLYVRLDNAKKLKVGNEYWRSADVFCIFCNTNIVCRVAHQL
ncbi:AvrD family protein [Ralstonia solanacearum]|uniref:Avrd-related protein n=1 Tax=Ralstonia solanacearum TaxID=305 RepID=A0AAE3NFV5_RALSL|nr:AvrD family protein [Ralstonia solanacearum]MDB0522832.1 avrd-related protein [Ralstonia solanacearum]